MKKIDLWIEQDDWTMRVAYENERIIMEETGDMPKEVDARFIGFLVQFLKVVTNEV